MSTATKHLRSCPPHCAAPIGFHAAAADRLYNAVDLMEISVPAQSVVFIAHDDRLDRPEWLTKQFQPTETSVTIDGKPMKVFEHHAAKDESLTLGTNTENEKAGPCNMYLVFVNSAMTNGK